MTSESYSEGGGDDSAAWYDEETSCARAGTAPPTVITIILLSTQIHSKHTSQHKDKTNEKVDTCQTQKTSLGLEHFLTMKF